MALYGHQKRLPPISWQGQGTPQSDARWRGSYTPLILARLGGIGSTPCFVALGGAWCAALFPVPKYVVVNGAGTLSRGRKVVVDGEPIPVTVAGAGVTVNGTQIEVTFE